MFSKQLVPRNQISHQTHNGFEKATFQWRFSDQTKRENFRIKTLEKQASTKLQHSWWRGLKSFMFIRWVKHRGVKTACLICFIALKAFFYLLIFLFLDMNIFLFYFLKTENITYASNSQICFVPRIRNQKQNVFRNSKCDPSPDNKKQNVF